MHANLLTQHAHAYIVCKYIRAHHTAHVLCAYTHTSTNYAFFLFLLNAGMHAITPEGYVAKNGGEPHFDTEGLEEEYLQVRAPCLYVVMFITQSHTHALMHA